MVNMDSVQYRIARAFMTRIEREDFETGKVEALAADTNLSPADFAKRFAAVL
jgi:6-phosphofructokinase 1